MKYAKISKIGKKIIILSLIITVYMFFALSVNAQTNNAWENQQGVNVIGLRAWGETNAPSDIRTITTRIVNVFLGLLAVIFLVLTVISGYKYMMASGNEEKAREAMGQLRTAIIGLLIILGAWGITYYVSSQIVNVTG